jgi:hypothetical protein
MLAAPCWGGAFSVQVETIASGQLLSYGDAGTAGNVSDPAVVGFGGWLAFQFLFAGKDVSGNNRIYAVNQRGQLLSYGDAGPRGMFLIRRSSVSADGRLSSSSSRAKMCQATTASMR